MSTLFPIGFIGPNYAMKVTDGSTERLLTITEAADRYVLTDGTLTIETHKTSAGAFSPIQFGLGRDLLKVGALVAETTYTIVEFVLDTDWTTTDLMTWVNRRFGAYGKFSKLAIKRALEAHGAWQAFKAALTESQYDDFMLAQDLMVSDIGFQQLLPGIQPLLNAYGITDGEIIILLENCVAN